MGTAAFHEAFQGLVGIAPYPWQIRLHRALRAGQPPTSCEIPTGPGKTAAIPIWLIVLARWAEQSRDADLPRRLICLAHRRTTAD